MRWNAFYPECGPDEAVKIYRSIDIDRSLNDGLSQLGRQALDQVPERILTSRVKELGNILDFHRIESSIHTWTLIDHVVDNSGSPAGAQSADSGHGTSKIEKNFFFAFRLFCLL